MKAKRDHPAPQDKPLSPDEEARALIDGKMYGQVAGLIREIHQLWKEADEVAAQDKPNTAPKSIPEESYDMLSAAHAAMCAEFRYGDAIQVGAFHGDMYRSIWRAMYSKHLEEQNWDGLGPGGA